MKNAKYWAEQFPIIVSANMSLLLNGHIDHPDLIPNQRRARARYLRFIRQVQRDARK